MCHVLYFANVFHAPAAFDVTKNVFAWQSSAQKNYRAVFLCTGWTGVARFSQIPKYVFTKCTKSIRAPKKITILAPRSRSEILVI